MPPGLQDLKKKKKIKKTEANPVRIWYIRNGASLGWKDLLQEEMTTHSNIAPWKIPWTEKFGRLLSMGSQRIRHNSAT